MYGYGRFMTIRGWRIWVPGEKGMTTSDYFVEGVKLLKSGWLQEGIPQNKRGDVWKEKLVQLRK